METLALLGVAAVLIIVFVSYFAPRLGIAAPVILVVVGVACSAIPGAPELAIEPDWILFVVLPPILYAAAVNVPVMDFRRNLGPIGALSVVLVIVSALVSAVVIWWLLPDLGFAAALALGAVISPPDAVAATAIGKRLGLPNRLVTILEGEGLVNDATALVLLRTAIAAMAGTVSLGQAVGGFALAVVIGIAVGFGVGLVSVWVRGKIRNQPVLTTAISFVVPFIAFMPAEQLGASGVLAVVVTGLVTGHMGLKRFSAQDRIAERTNWRTIQLLLENGVFLLMGFQMMAIVGDVQGRGAVGLAVGLGLLVTVVLFVVRSLFVIPLIAALRRQQRRAAVFAPKLDAIAERFAAAGPPPGQTAERGLGQRWARANQMVRTRRADGAYLVSEGLGWRGGAVLAWSGMRGVVTLAAVQTLPTTIPHRSELVLAAFTVAIVTLVVQGGTLPLVIRLLKIQGSDAERERRELARLADELESAVDAVLDNEELTRANGAAFDPDVIDSLRERRLSASGALETMLHPAEPDGRIAQLRELRRLLIDAELNALHATRAEGSFSSSTLERAQGLIDIELSRIEGAGGH